MTKMIGVTNIEVEEVADWKHNINTFFEKEANKKRGKIFIDDHFGRLDFSSVQGEFWVRRHLDWFRQARKGEPIIFFEDWRPGMSLLEICGGPAIPAETAQEILNLPDDDPGWFVAVGLNVRQVLPREIRDNKKEEVYEKNKKINKAIQGVVTKEGGDIETLLADICKEEFLHSFPGGIREEEEGNYCHLCGRPLGYWVEGDFPDTCPSCDKIARRILTRLWEAGHWFCFFCGEIFPLSKLKEEVSYGQGMHHTEVAHLWLYSSRWREIPGKGRKWREPRPWCGGCKMKKYW